MYKRQRYRLSNAANSETIERLTAAKLSMSSGALKRAGTQLEEALGSDAELRSQLARLVEAKGAPDG